jgi:hypothetical protein
MHSPLFTSRTMEERNVEEEEEEEEEKEEEGRGKLT